MRARLIGKDQIELGSPRTHPEEGATEPLHRAFLGQFNGLFLLCVAELVSGLFPVLLVGPHVVGTNIWKLNHCISAQIIACEQH